MLARTLLTMLLLLAAGNAAAYTTPGSGVDWTLDDLVAASGGAVLGGGGNYQVLTSVIVAAGDRLTMAPGDVVTFIDTAGTVGLEVRGSLVGLGTAEARIVLTGSVATPGSWRGLNFRETAAGSTFHLAHAEIAYANEALVAVGAPITLEHCELRHTGSRALGFSGAGGLVSHCWLHHHQQRTITITLSASPTIEHCLFEHNNLQNTSPYPYVNIGLQGTNSPTIRGNTIRGSGNHMSGGISVWALSNALIEGNHIEGCGYGILCYQTGASPVIRDNVIVDNNIHPDTVNWGFGIACNGNNAPIVAENSISGHWYGVAAINGGRPNLGDLINDFPGDDGGNLIVGNGLGGQVYGFYNNTPLAQMAQGNWWGGSDAQTVEDAIFHQPDNAALGLVDYAFWLTAASAPGSTVPTATLLSAVTAYPNPFNPLVSLGFTLAEDSAVNVAVVDLRGRLLRELHAGPMTAGERRLTWDGTDQDGRALPGGVYFARVVAGAESQARKLVLVR